MHGHYKAKSEYEDQKNATASSEAREVTTSGKKMFTENKQYNVKNTQNHESIWQAFKASLAQRTTQWRHSRNERNTRLESILASGSKKEKRRLLLELVGRLMW